ncbi:hypothetical protein [Micromonospora sp. CPCC 205556]|uniref:hypothetical protein n=1 Tax=Micromonospora sp. CPCC 205556 TaxID=3122398 RepID=UPI002FF3092E
MHVWPRALAGAGLLPSIMAAAHLTLTRFDGPVWWVVVWLPVLLAAFPLAVVHPEPFWVACLASAVLLIVLAVPGFWFGYYLHLPAALVLFTAAAADPRRAPWRARVAVAIGGLLAATATALYAWAWAHS